MQKQSANGLQSCSKRFFHDKWFKKVLISILVINILIGGYVLFSLYKSKQPPLVARGINLYTKKSYLQYENGIKFKNYIKTVEHITNGTVTDFRYFDFKKRDSLIWGKFTDFYWVEYEFKTGFEELFDYIQNNKTNSLMYDSWTYFEMKATENTGFYLFVDEQRNIIRAVYITDPQSWSMPRFLMSHEKYCEWT